MQSAKKVLKIKCTCNDTKLAKKWQESQCYQLANRLAFVHFCEKIDIEAELLYINFINGYEPNINKNITEKKKWEEKWEKEYKTLELSDKLKAKIHHVYIDCHQPNNKI